MLSLPLVEHFLCKHVSEGDKEVAAARHTLLSKLLLQLFCFVLRLLCGGLQAPCALLAGLDSRLELDIDADLLRLEVIVCARLCFNLDEQCLD